MRRFPGAENLLQELRHGVRVLRRNRGFSIVTVVTLGLGIGASTAIFSVVDAVLLRPLPYPAPGKIVAVREQGADGREMNLADPNFDDFRARNHTLSALAEYGEVQLSVAGGTEPVRITAAVVSRDFFRAMGIGPFLGRSFDEDELRLHGARATIVSYGYWRRYLEGSSDLSQFRLTFNEGIYSVIGVMPQGFDFPLGATIWVARELEPELPSRRAHNWESVARVRDNASLVQATADLKSIARQIHVEYGQTADLTSADVVPLANIIVVGNVHVAVLTLFWAVMLLFLIGCINVAGLLLARTSARRKELAVRVAIGASVQDLVRQFLAESFIFSVMGGLLGIGVALCATRLLPVILPTNLPRQEGIGINLTVLSFAVVVTVGVAFGLGLFTAWHAGSDHLGEALSTGGKTYTLTRASHRLRSFLVVAEIASTLVMLVGAGLLGRSFLRLTSVNPGFHEGHLMLVTFSPSMPNQLLANIRSIRFADDALTRLQASPGIQSAGLTAALPMVDTEGFPDGGFLILNGQPAPTNFQEFMRIAQNPKQVGEARYGDVSAGYFTTLEIPLIRGRIFNAQDGPDSPNVAVISESLARRQWPQGDAIGQIIDFGNMDGNLTPLTIVGVVGDIRTEGLDQPPTPVIYVDCLQRGIKGTSPTIVLRTALPPSTIVPLASSIFHSLDANVPVKFSTFTNEMRGWLSTRRFLLLLAGVFAGTALGLAAVGVYGIVAHSVARRTPEIGIRIALGAQRSDILRLVVGEGARLAATGLLIGLAAALALTRLMSSLLFGIKTTDPLTLLAVALLFSAVVLIASYIPARRAARVAPIDALRYE